MTVARYRSTTSDDTHRDWIMLLPAAAELAKAVAGTDFVPKAMRDRPGQIAAAILYGDELGLGPMQSLAKIAVIDGRPSLAAETQRALILEAGHELWLEESSISRAVWAGRRAGSERVVTVTWTMDDARRANLAGKPNWRNYPRQMLSARASAELARALFADAIGGLMAREELEDGEPQLPALEGDGAPPPEPKSTRRRRARGTSAPTSAPPVAILPSDTPADELPPLPGEPGTDKMSKPQQNKMFALFRARGYGEGSRAARLAYASAVIDRNVSSAAELTADEAAAIITALEQDETELGPPDSGPGVEDPLEARAPGPETTEQPELL